LERGLAIKFPTLANRQLAEQGMKYCPTCKQVKSLNEFSTMKVRSGVASHCRECTKEWQQKYNTSPSGKDVRRTFYRKNRDRWIDQKLQKKFGITLQQYKTILDNQSGMCIICGRTPAENGKMLAVDHSHKTGKNRGLLCSSCNICIGFIEKNNLNPETIKLYLEKHNVTS
jgi:hypothetical protein